jgi:hypothetical protein
MSNPIVPNTDASNSLIKARPACLNPNAEYENLEEAEPVEYFGIVAITKDGYVLLSDEVENPEVLQDKLVAIQRYRKTARIEVTGLYHPIMPKQAAELGDDHA